VVLPVVMLPVVVLQVVQKESIELPVSELEQEKKQPQNQQPSAFVLQHKPKLRDSPLFSHVCLKYPGVVRYAFVRLQHRRLIQASSRKGMERGEY
jgi:hypothetical protein